MPAVTYNHWEAGLDVRQGASVADANRLRVLQNAFITNGRVPQKRPALDEAFTLPANTHGLTSMDGVLHVFYDAQHGSISTGTSKVKAEKLTSIAGSPDIIGITYAEHYAAQLYVVAEYANGKYQHHYIDGSADTRVTDANCPQTAVVCKKASKMWAVSPGAGDTVRFTSTENGPRDWSTADDSGFLPTNLQADGNDRVKALGTYNNLLVVFTDDHAQLWSIDPNPELHQFVKLVFSGARDSYAHDGMVGDLFFLSNQGVRSITLQAGTDNVKDVDVGTAIDLPISKETGIARAAHVRKYGQYWLWFGSTVYVYTFSKVSKVSAWSVYEFPIGIDNLAEAYQTVYIRTGDKISQLVDDKIYKDFGNEGTEDGIAIEVIIEMPYVDLQKPGVMKMLWGADFVFSGAAEFAVKYDPRDPDAQTKWQSIIGDSRPGAIKPVELQVTNLAPVVRHRNNEPFRLDLMTFYYETLGVL